MALAEAAPEAAPAAAAPGAASADAAADTATIRLLLKEDNAELALITDVDLKKTTSDAFIKQVSALPVVADLLRRYPTAAVMAGYTGLAATVGSQLKLDAALGLTRLTAKPIPDPIPVTLVLYARNALPLLHPYPAEKLKKADETLGTEVIRVTVPAASEEEDVDAGLDVKVIKVNAAADTVLTLKQKIFSATGIPVSQQALFAWNGQHALNDDEEKVSSYIGGSNIVLEQLLSPEERGGYGPGASFFAGHLNCLNVQTHKGIAAFFCTLRVMNHLYNDHMSITYRNGVCDVADEGARLLGRFYQLTRSTPATNVLRRALLSVETLPRQEMLVLLEACYALFRRIIPSSTSSSAASAGAAASATSSSAPMSSGNRRVEDSSVLENSDVCWSYLLQTIADDDANVIVVGGVPKPKPADGSAGDAPAASSSSAAQYVVPDSDHNSCVRVDAAIDITDDDYDIMSTRIVPEGSSKPAAAAAGAGASSPNTAGAGAASASSSSALSATVHRILSPPPEPHDKDSWTRLNGALALHTRLHFLSASRLRSSALVKPALTYNWLIQGLPSVILPHELSGAAVAGEVRLYNPISGASSTADIEELIEAQGNQYAAASAGGITGFTRPAKEAIIVVLGRSGSMGAPAFPARRRSSTLPLRLLPRHPRPCFHPRSSRPPPWPAYPRRRLILHRLPRLLAVWWLPAAVGVPSPPLPLRFLWHRRRAKRLLQRWRKRPV